MKIKAKKEPVHRCLVTKKITIFIVQNLNAVPQPTLTHVMQTNRPRRHTPERLIQVDGFYEKSPPLHYELVKVCVFYGGRRRRWISYIRRDLASTQRKNEKSRRGGRIVQLQYCVMKKNPKATYCCISPDHKHEVALLGGISERRSKREVVGYH